MAANPLQFPSKTLKMDVQNSDGVATIQCVGRVTSDTSDALKIEVKKLIPETKKIVLDLSKVDYMDSSGLGSLLGLYISAKAAGCELRLTNLSDRLAELLRITKLAAVFDSYGQYM